MVEEGKRVEEGNNMFNILINVAHDFIEKYLNSIKVVVEDLVFND